MNKITVQGVEYEERPTDGMSCKGCVAERKNLENAELCRNLGSCAYFDRPDNINIIFIKTEE